MECFSVMSDEIEGRIDPLYYSQDILQEFKKTKFNFVEIRELVNYLKSGFPAGKEQQSHAPNKFIQIRPTNIDKDNELIFDKNIYLSDKLANLKEEEIVLKDEVLFNNTNSQELVGKTTFFSLDGKYFCSNHITRIGVNGDKLNPKYLMIILNIYQKSKVFFNLCTNWNNQSGVNNNLLSSIKIPLPPLATQNKIVSLMDSAYSSKKSKETQAQKLLDSINDYVLDELGIKLPELEDKMTYVVSSEEVKNNRCDAYYYQPKFEKIEKAINKGKFEVKELKEIVKKIKTGTTPHQKLEPFTENKEVIFLRNTNLYRNRLILDDVRYVKNELSKNLTYSLKNDIIICIAGTLGLTAVNIFDDKISINQNISSLTLRENINPHFISAILNLKIYDLLFKRVASLATIFYINNDNLLSIKIPLPPLPLQNKIADEVNQRMQKAEQLQKEAKEELEKVKQEVEEMILS